MTRATTSAALALMGVLSAASFAMADQPPPPPSAANGQALFMKHTCYFCHGTVGQGAGPTGTRVGPPSRAVAGFIAFVRRPSGAMPAFSAKILSDAELTDIYAFLRTIPPAKAATDIPLLRMLKQR